MKQLKKAGLGVLTAAAILTSIAGSASATTVTSPTGTVYTGFYSLSSESVITLHGINTVTCVGSNITASISSHGAGVTAKGPLSNLTFTGCGFNTVTVKKAGSFEIHGIGNGAGTVTWSGGEITTSSETIFGTVDCVYTTNSTHLGTITEGIHSTLHVDSATIPRTGGSALCGASGELTGSYSIWSPTVFKVDP
jgi:hypothetical protein